jgi:hypothetical protein
MAADASSIIRSMAGFSLRPRSASKETEGRSQSSSGRRSDDGDAYFSLHVSGYAACLFST